MGGVNKTAMTSLLLAMVSCMAVIISVYQREGLDNEVVTEITDYNNNAAVLTSYVYSSDRVTWDEARLECSRLGMRLATVDSKAKWDAVRHATGNAGVWIGYRSPVNQQNQKDKWVWQSRAPAQGGANDYWAPNEPNKDARWPDEWCAEMLTNGKFNNLKCNDRRWLRGYVCDNHPLVPTPVLRFHSGRALTWDEANDDCRRRFGSGLGTLKNWNDQLKAYVRGNNVWTGLRIPPERRWDKNGWDWASMQPRGQIVWGHGEPNNWGPGEHCAHLRGDGRYNDIWCHHRFNFYICDRSWSHTARFRNYDRMAEVRPGYGYRVPAKAINSGNVGNFIMSFELRYLHNVPRWGNIMQVGFNDHERRPALYQVPNQRQLFVSFLRRPHGWGGCHVGAQIHGGWLRVRVEGHSNRLIIKYNDRVVCNHGGHGFQPRNYNLPIDFGSRWHGGAAVHTRRFGLRYW